jgi:hypothetical protein
LKLLRRHGQYPEGPVALVPAITIE